MPLPVKKNARLRGQTPIPGTDRYREEKGACTPAMWAKAWSIYFYDTSIGNLARELNLANNTARRLVREGLPNFGLEPLEVRLATVMKARAAQEDNDMVAAVAIGKKALRRQLKILSQRQDSLDTETEGDPTEIPAAVVGPQIAALTGLSTKMHPDVSYRIHGRKITEEELKADPEAHTAETLGFVFGGLLDEIVKRRLPQALDARPERDPD